ncbi:MAG TPA: BMP family ABC transporter substrate-binding protein [Acidimicrobiales bacterium]|nr:BMP family ABC transporter substrate-binding protein [Acidimicrobiales bacterium]
MVRLGRKLTTGVAVALIGAVGAGGALAGAATGSGSGNPWGWPGNATEGYLPPHEPAVHGGKVKIGLITAGTIHDHGYYQSEVDAIKKYAKIHNWTTIIQGSVKTADALSAAQNMCSQNVDLLVIGESQLAAATPAASSTSCKTTPVWIFSAPYVKLTTASLPYLHLAETTGSNSTFATGVAMGLWMKTHHQTTAGFITGPALSFTEGAAQGYLAGIHYVLPKAKMDAVYTGTLTASGPAITAATSMIAKGIKMIFPYLGASLIPTAKYISSHGGASPSDGGNYCAKGGAKYAILQAYDPGYLLDPALTQFAHGKMRVGVTEHFALGKTSIPAVAFCKGAGVSTKSIKKLKTVITKLENGTITATKLTKATPIPK